MLNSPLNCSGFCYSEGLWLDMPQHLLVVFDGQEITTGRVGVHDMRYISPTQGATYLGTLSFPREPSRQPWNAFRTE